MSSTTMMSLVMDAMNQFDLNTLLILLLFSYLCKRLLDGIVGRLDSIDGTLQLLAVSMPQRLDPWHRSLRDVPAPYERPKKLLANATTYYFGHKDATPKCAVTGIPGDRTTQIAEPVTLTHLVPRNSGDIVYQQLGLDASQDRDGNRMCLFLCSSIAQAYQRKELSFYQVGKEGGQSLFKMKLWAPNVGKRLVHKGAKEGETIEKYADQTEEDVTFRFDDGKIPYARVLSSHHKSCYANAELQGWLGSSVDAVDLRLAWWQAKRQANRSLKQLGI